MSHFSLLRRLRIGSLLAISFVAACGGGSDDGPPVSTTPSVNPAGIWAGPVDLQGTVFGGTALALVEEDGSTLAILPLRGFPPNASGPIIPYVLDGNLCCQSAIDSLVTAVPPNTGVASYQVRVQGKHRRPNSPAPYRRRDSWVSMAST